MAHRAGRQAGGFQLLRRRGAAIMSDDARTFANIRLRNQLAPGTEGGWTVYVPGGEKMSIYDAAMKYQKAGVPLVVLGGKE